MKLVGSSLDEEFVSRGPRVDGIGHLLCLRLSSLFGSAEEAILESMLNGGEPC